VPAELSGPVVQVPRITPADVPVSTRVLRSRATSSRSLYGDRLRSEVPKREGFKENLYLQAPSYADDSDEDVRAFTEDAHGTEDAFTEWYPYRILLNFRVFWPFLHMLRLLIRWCLRSMRLVSPGTLIRQDYIRIRSGI
jgi:hypothetical protein